MDQKKYFQKKLIISLNILAIIGLFYISCAHSQLTNWWPLPPYNTLWPLWSLALSPLNATGLPIPIVNSITPYTVLPVQPALTWDPGLTYPWLLYNTPSGLAYYDPLYGIDFWPPDYLISSLGPPIPIVLDAPALSLPPTNTYWLLHAVPIANKAFTSLFAINSPLLTPNAIIGLSPMPP